MRSPSHDNERFSPGNIVYCHLFCQQNVDLLQLGDFVFEMSLLLNSNAKLLPFSTLFGDICCFLRFLICAHAREVRKAVKATTTTAIRTTDVSAMILLVLLSSSGGDTVGVAVVLVIADGMYERAVAVVPPIVPA